MTTSGNINLTTISVGVLALAALICATVLTALHDDATHAWEAFAGLVIFFGGVHVPAPTQSAG